MKKINLLLAILPILFLMKSAYSQSFQKGSMVLDGRYEFGLYGTKSTDKITNVTKNGNAGSNIYNLSFEYGLTNWLGVGAKFQYDNFLTQKDTVRDFPNPKDFELVTPSLRGFEFAGIVNAHFVRKKTVDMYGGISFGYSSILFKRNSVDNARASGGGTWFDIHLSPRFYFGEHFGMTLNIAYAAFNYSDLNVQNNSVQPVNAFGLKGSGVNLGVGLMYKISSN